MRIFVIWNAERRETSLQDDEFAFFGQPRKFLPCGNVIFESNTTQPWLVTIRASHGVFRSVNWDSLPVARVLFCNVATSTDADT